MQFEVIPRSRPMPSEGSELCVLRVDGWDDFGHQTMFDVHLFDRRGRRHDLGSVKIASDGMDPGQVPVPDSFEKLPPTHCSVGQDRNYYETLSDLPMRLRRQFLVGIRDCVHSSKIWARFRDQRAVQTSLLRSISESDVELEFPIALAGDAELTPYSFRFDGGSNAELEFQVTPLSQPPTNVHALIGRNGVGKTRLLAGMAQSLIGHSVPEFKGIEGEFLFDEDNARSGSLSSRRSRTGRFSNLVVVSFSIFDKFDPSPRTDVREGMRYRYIGSRTEPEAEGAQVGPIKTDAELRDEFAVALRACTTGNRRRRWQTAMQTLQSDPGFVDLSLPDPRQPEGRESPVGTFDSLSSGHKVVLLAMARLVESVDERSLVLVDEPETHLHPPLLSSFVRALSTLLRQRNGVAIVATHSPVVLQEVPRKCAWVLHRSGSVLLANRPSIETFGENVGVLTREVFGLEVTHSGYHRLLSEAAEGSDYEDVLRKFGDEVGAEGRAILRAIVASREQR